MVLLNESHYEIQQAVRTFAKKEIAPYAREWDENSIFPFHVFQKMGRLGFLGIPFSEEYGGVGLDTLHYAIAVEELGKSCGGVGLSYAAAVSLGASPLYYFGTKKQKETYLPSLLSGQSLGSFGLTEPAAGSDAGGTRTTAKKVGDKWILNGEKCWITNASHASTIITTASIGKSATGKNQIGAFIVEGNAKGVSITTPYDKMGVRASNTCSIVYDNVEVPEENVLGDLEKGFAQFLYTLDGGRISIAALSVGIAQSAYEKALTYAKQREQFGKKLTDFQAIQFKLANMATQIHLARLAVYEAAMKKDKGLPFGKEAAIAKLFASEIATAVSLEAVQIHGGNGYMKEYDVERHVRDAKLMEIGEGTSEIQRLVIFRHLLKGSEGGV